MVRRDPGIDDGLVHRYILRGKEPDHAGAAHGNAVGTIKAPDHMLSQIRSGVFHVFLYRDESRAPLIVPVGNKQVYMIVPGKLLSGSLEDPPWLGGALKHGEGLFLFRAEFINSHRSNALFCLCCSGLFI